MMRHRLERGQAIILVLVALALFLFAALGLAIDASHMYAQRQMAQSAADGAARAAIYSIFTKTNTSGGATDFKNAFGASNFECSSTTINLTPCHFANQAGFSYTNGDTVAVKFPTSVPNVALSPAWTPGPGPFPAAVEVTVIRTVQTGLMRFGGPSSSKVAAQATACIVRTLSPVPIIVLHPSLPESFKRGGTSYIEICGGPSESIQVNSTSKTAAANNGGGGLGCGFPCCGCIDTSKAGPDATKGAGGIPNCDGSGADVGVKGGPPTYPGTLLTGVGRYVQPYGPIWDPLRDVPTPATTGLAVNPAPINLVTGSPAALAYGCPPAPPKPCQLWKPGLYNDGNGIEVKNHYGLFMPGLYYIVGGGFHGAAGSTMKMATCPVASPGAGFPAILGDDPNFLCGMMVYNTGNGNQDVFEVGANGDATLLGSTDAGLYKSILFFEDHNSAGHTGVSGGHKLGGGGNLSLIGTIYLTDTVQTSTKYQELVLRGNSGNVTKILGEIIVDVLDAGGAGEIQMLLDPDRVLPVDKVALVK